MVCRTTRIGSAATSYARLSTGLRDQQTLSAFHDLLREGRDRATPTQDQIHDLCIRTSLLVRDDPTLSDANRRSILARLDAAVDLPMDGRTFYAAERINDRARRGVAALNEHYDQAARALGWSRAQVQTWVNERVAQAETDGRGTSAPTAWRRDLAADEPYLPLDRSTAYALHSLQQHVAQQRAEAPSRTTVTRHPVNSSAVAAIGYDPVSGRLEIEMHSYPGRAYAYRVPASVYEQLVNAPSIGSYYARNIRSNPEYQYDTDTAARAAAQQSQCPTCGQFAGDDHACPVRDSVEERNRTERLARDRQRRQARTNPTATPDPAVSDAAAQPAPPSAEATRLLVPTRSARRYASAAGAFRTMNLTAARQSARQSGRISIPIASTIIGVHEEGQEPTRIDAGRVRGRVEIAYGGRGQGYTVNAVTEPGDSGNDQLRCSCPQYQTTYDCPHVRQTVAEIQQRLNARSLRGVPTLAQAQAAVAADLSRDRAESIAAQNTAISTWGQPEVTYATDHAAFQREYRAAKRRAEAGESPVPYMTENATDGLGARDTGRGFGVELEFDINPGVNQATALAAIGRDLRAAGLTRSTNQQGYHASAGRGYTDQHRGGWSFEHDVTVAGEIVSPIMYDEPETWQNLAKVCEIVKRHGGTVSTGTGSHVHVGAGDYDHTVENHYRLMRTFAAHEDLMYRLSTNPERGTHRGPSWCRPNQVPSAGYSTVTDARNANNGHRVGVNLQSVFGEANDHVEFRTWDGSLDPAVIQTQIKVSLGVTAAAFRDRDGLPAANEPLGSHRASNRAQHGGRGRLTGEAWQADTASFRGFADKLFRRASDKAQLTSLFAVTKWQKTR